MKKQKFYGKLNLNKETISRLQIDEMKIIEGGAISNTCGISMGCSSILCLTKHIDVPTWGDGGICPSDGCGIG